MVVFLVELPGRGRNHGLTDSPWAGDRDDGLRSPLSVPPGRGDPQLGLGLWHLDRMPDNDLSVDLAGLSVPASADWPTDTPVQGAVPIHQVFRLI